MTNWRPSGVLKKRLRVIDYGNRKLPALPAPRPTLNLLSV